MIAQFRGCGGLSFGGSAPSSGSATLSIGHSLNFLSRLFSVKRPPLLDADSSAEALFRAYAAGKPDMELFKSNLQAIQNLLVKEHKFGLTAEDQSNIEYVYRCSSSRVRTSIIRWAEQRWEEARPPMVI